VEALDLLQLHCPPFPAYYMPELFETMDYLVAAGKIKHYGVSVKKWRKRSKPLSIPE